ncbi:MAG: polyphosphate kinase 2 [Saprospiraceae bacterium]|jgi:polyphosphate kinase 2|nr:polyphosphate kinase 2 [Saprospiraceae bacterium]MBK7796486.1 polyphosphate kinase 2 [Saprospiraceae bacterium]MBK9378901.1 polyphosphate kinase 2 [Saprospiraceae bacterium]MBL0260122.1 polyphosphate kinase 2 [Saprospiraceae bacterium]
MAIQTGRKPIKENGVEKTLLKGKSPKTVAENIVSTTDSSDATIKLSELSSLKTKSDLRNLFQKNNSDAAKVIESIRYEEELEKLQIELVKLQRWIQAKNKRLAILFEGRDAAGKGGTIRRFTEHLNPRAMRVVALPKPTEEEQGQWYFQRYTKQLPNRGEMVFFDRSWYNRAVVEPVNGFCTKDQYNTFLHQVPEFEHMLHEDGITIIKFWFSISKDEQLRRFKSRQANPLKQWKLSPVDMKAQDMWDIYTQYKEDMFSKTHNSFSPWIVVKANNKQKARLESIRYVLSVIPYEGKDEKAVSLHPNPNIITRFHRKASVVD